MINYIISILVSLGFWGKATQETEEKTEKSSWLRTFVYAVLTILVCVLFYKTYQIQESHWCVFAMQAKGAYNQKGESLDSLSIMVRKFVTAHDSEWMKLHNEKYYWSGIEFEYICSNDSNAVYKLNRSLDVCFPLSILATCPIENFNDKSIPGYSAIEKVRSEARSASYLNGLMYKYSEELNLEPWEIQVLHNFEDSLYCDIAAAYKAFFLMGKPESLRPYMYHSDNEDIHTPYYPFFESIRNIDAETIRKSRLTFSFMNGERMSYEESMKYLKELNLINGDLYEITAFIPQKYTKQQDGMRWKTGYHANSEEYSTDFFSAFDFSQSLQSIQINSNIPIGLFQLRFDIPFELIGCNPKPDYLTMTDIGFKDPEKTKKIQKEGVSLHVKFPTLENKQLIRSLILTTVLTALLSLFLSNLYHCLRKVILSKKEKHKIIISKKFQYFINTIIVVALGCLLYYSYILVSQDKILISDNDFWYYISCGIIFLVLLISLIILAYKKLK